jgi:hypothetical protein
LRDFRFDTAMINLAVSSEWVDTKVLIDLFVCSHIYFDLLLCKLVAIALAQVDFLIYAILVNLSTSLIQHL